MQNFVRFIMQRTISLFTIVLTLLGENDSANLVRYCGSLLTKANAIVGVFNVIVVHIEDP